MRGEKNCLLIEDIKRKLKNILSIAVNNYRKEGHYAPIYISLDHKSTEYKKMLGFLCDIARIRKENIVDNCLTAIGFKYLQGSANISRIHFLRVIINTKRF